MSPKEHSSQNVWFGVSMFLLGLISGAVIVSSAGGFLAQSGGPSAAPVAPTDNQPQVSISDRMIAIAKDIGLDTDAFQTCISTDGPAFTDKINAQMQEGQAAGVNGTPGNILLDLRSKKARVVSGAQPLANFEKNIDEMLANPNAKISGQMAEEAGTVVPVDFDKDYYTGSKNASIALIEYIDYECPFCHAVHPTHQQLLQKYEGKVVWVMRHFPLSFHQNAMPMAIGAECAGKLGGNEAFWKMTDALVKQ